MIVVYEVSADRKQGVHFKGCLVESNEQPWVPKIEIKDGDAFVRQIS